MKYGLVLEGGSRKGMFTAGVLDNIMDAGIKFQYVNGVSAGAHAAINYVSGQSRRLKEVLCPSAIREGRRAHLIADGIQSEFHKMTYEYSYGVYPFDFNKYFNSDIEVEIGMTCCETGKAEFHNERESEERLLNYVSASCSLPMLFPEKEIDGKHFVDGCVSDSIPFDRAFEMGCDKVFIISTKVPGDAPVDFKKMQIVLSAKFEKKYPALYESLMNRYDTYQRQWAELLELEEQGKILMFKPTKPLCSLFETSSEKLFDSYNHGFTYAKERMGELKKFLDLE